MCDMVLSEALKRLKTRQKLSAAALCIHCLSLGIKGSLLLRLVSQEVESLLSSTMCRVKSVGTVVVDVEPARAETDTQMRSYAGADAPPKSLGTADFALQLVSMLLILLCLTAAMYFAYKRRQMMRKSYTDFATQTDSEVGTREDLDRVIKTVSNLQHQVLTLGLERESERRLEEMRRSRSASQELLHENGDVIADMNPMLPQQ